MCDVCCESFNKSTRVKTTCPFCPFSACSACSERYLCETQEDAHCMACRKGWSREILSGNFSQKFMSKIYKTRREDLLFEREKSLMPATQPYVEIEKNIRAINNEIVKIKFAIERATEKYNYVMSRQVAVIAVEYSLSSEFDAIIKRREIAKEQRKVISNMNIDLQHYEWHQVQLFSRLHGGILDQEKRQFVRACPYADCRGFLSTAWKCGMCENWACPECHEVKGLDKDAPHTCNPDDVATARLLAKDSRGCPKCAAMIFKINGCDQMYCTQCHTAFSWRTGHIERGTIHNPHYYDYMRAHGGLARAPGDVPCGGLPDWAVIARHITRSSSLWVPIANAHRSYPHCQFMVIPRYTVDVQQDNRDMRIKLMIGDISDDEFKKKIQQREKARQRKNDIRQVIEMYMAVLLDLFQEFAQSGSTATLYNSLTELRSHVNSTLGAVSTRYGKCAVPTISENYDVY